MYISVDPYDLYCDLGIEEKRELTSYLIQDGYLTGADFDGTIELLENALYRIKYKGLDQDKSAVDVLESILESLKYL